MQKDKLVIGGLVVLMVGLIAFVLYKQKYDYRKLPYYTFSLNSEEYLFSEIPPKHTVGDFNFTDQNGEKVNTAKLGDCIYVADYIFTTCPGICKIMTTDMSEVYQEFKNEPHFKILSHTSKPEEDNVSVLLNYARSKGVEDTKSWLFLTGDKKELQRMAYEQYGIVNEKDLQEEGSFVHTEMFVLVDKNKYIRGYYDGTNKTEVNQMVRDVKELLKEQYH
ncbi:MAG TPA: SCO family protein [Cytophagaceae bacterium]|nr:SCO family protein [Cytophagaceae bacterium]